MLAPIAWRTPPRHYGPWEQVTSVLTERLVDRGIDVTLFATADSITRARLVAVCPRGYEEDATIDAKVWEALHVSEVFERAGEFDLIHNHFDFLPLAFSRLVDTPVLTTIHGFSSRRILPAYQKYNGRVYYVSISDADRAPDLTYLATVYHGIDLDQFTFRDTPEDYLLYFGRIHPDKGTREAIEIARKARRRLLLAGIVQDRSYYEREVAPAIDGDHIRYLGSVGPAERRDLLAGAAALLHPIAFNEPFGLSVVEAMASGTPTIAFPRGSMPEIVSHGETGFLVSSVEEAVAAVERLHHISRARCRDEAVRRFSADRMADDYVRLYELVVAPPRPTTAATAHA
jgi:glycosyltransferase involved in cell wall biosynthesis